MTLINRSTVCAQCRGSHAPLLSYETVARGVTGTVLLHPECMIVWTSARWVEAEASRGQTVEDAWNRRAP